MCDISVIKSLDERCRTGPYLIDDMNKRYEGIGSLLMHFNRGIRLAVHYNMTLLTHKDTLVSVPHHTNFSKRLGLLLGKDCSVDEVRKAKTTHNLVVVKYSPLIEENRDCSDALLGVGDFNTYELFTSIANILQANAELKSNLVIELLSRDYALCFDGRLGFKDTVPYYHKHYAMQYDIDMKNGEPRIADRSSQSLKTQLLISYHLRAGDVATDNFSYDLDHPNTRALSPRFAVPIIKTILSNRSVLHGVSNVTLHVYMEREDTQSTREYVLEAGAFIGRNLTGIDIVFFTGTIH